MRIQLHLTVGMLLDVVIICRGPTALGSSNGNPGGIQRSRGPRGPSLLLMGWFASRIDIELSCGRLDSLGSRPLSHLDAILGGLLQCWL